MLTEGVHDIVLYIDGIVPYGNYSLLDFLEKMETSYLFLYLGVLVTLLIARTYTKRALRNLRDKKDEYRTITEETMRAITKTIDAKDPYTKGHSYRVAYFSVEIAKRLHLDEDEIERIHYIALMHDIGKIGIPDSILHKPDQLTKDEFEVMKKHPSIGGDILKDITHIKDIVVGAECHHEHYDGTGYPKGLKGDNIPLVARIIGIADAYDTMTLGRHYQSGMSSEEVIKELKRCSGTQFDPSLVPIMIDIILQLDLRPPV